MNGSLIGRIIWKEYRQQRALLLSVAAVCIVSQFAVVLTTLVAGASLNVEGLFVIGLGMPTLYALGCGALLFAGEDEAGTGAFLRSTPLTPRDLLLGKVGFAVSSCLLLMATLWLGTLAITQGVMPDPASHLRIWLICLVAWIEVLTWSALYSLLIQRVLWATLVAGCTAGLVGTLWFFAVGGQFLSTDTAHLRTLPVHLATLVVVALAVMYGTRRWLGETPWIARRVAAEPRVTHLTKPTPRSRFVACRRLVWQEQRQSAAARWLVLAAAVVSGIPLSLNGEFATESWHPVLLIAPLLAAALGACVFAGDQSQARFRYFCERGVSPRMVWLTRQFVWGSYLLIALLSVCLISPLFVTVLPTTLLFLLGPSLVFYSIGQACSLFIRSSLLAIVATIAGCLLAASWIVVANQLFLPAIPTMFAIPPILLFATWLRMPHWVTESTTWRARLQALGSVAIPGLTLLVVLGTHRATEIPSMPLPFDRVEVERAPIQAERKTTELHASAWRQFQAAAVADPRSIEDTPSLRAQALADFMTAAAADACRFPSYGELQSGQQPDLVALAVHVTEMAENMERQGRLEEALEVYWALLRFDAQLLSQPNLLRHVQGAEVEQLVLARLPRWAALPGQSSAGILEVAAQLETRLTELQPDFDLSLAGDYNLYRRLFELDPPTVRYMVGENALKLRYVAWLASWEQTRMLRLLDASANSQLEHAKTVWNSLTTGGRPRRDPFPADFFQIERWRVTTPLFEAWGPNRQMIAVADLTEMETHRRAARIQLALVAWQLEHHELPVTLHALVGHGLARVPDDPWSGLPVHYAPRGGYELDQATKRFSTGAPCLWFAGRQLEFLETDLKPLYRNFSFQRARLDSEYDLWQHGVRVPIPRVADGAR